MRTPCWYEVKGLRQGPGPAKWSVSHCDAQLCLGVTEYPEDKKPPDVDGELCYLVMPYGQMAVPGTMDEVRAAINEACKGSERPPVWWDVSELDFREGGASKWRKAYVNVRGVLDISEVPDEHRPADVKLKLSNVMLPGPHVIVAGLPAEVRDRIEEAFVSAEREGWGEGDDD